MGCKTGIDAQQTIEAFDQQSGADQRDQRQRDLGDDQRAAQPSAFDIARRTAASRSLIQISARRLPGRNQAEDQPCYYRRRKREQQRRGVDANAAQSGNIGLVPRSEEHTSELQSLTNLVCRLLLEKKKTRPIIHNLASV